MERERSKGVSIFAILLMTGAFMGTVYWLIISAPENEYSPGEMVFYFFEFLAIPTIAAIGIFKRKNWARLMCLGLAWLACIAIVILGLTFGISLSSGSDSAVGVKVLLLALAVCGPVIFFLTRPKVKEQFK